DLSGNLTVERPRSAVEPFGGERPGRDNRLSRLRRGQTRELVGHLQLGRRDSRHVQLDVDAIEKRAGEPREVATPGVRRADTVGVACAVLTAGTRIGGQDKLEPTGEMSDGVRAMNADDT